MATSVASDANFRVFDCNDRLKLRIATPQTMLKAANT